jgi:hypothetical protein
LAGGAVAAAIDMSLQQERAYRVRRHLLAAQEPWPVATVVERHMGLHAARLSSPWVALRARMRSFQTADLRSLLVEERSLIKLRCMRRTLHILPLDLAPIAHAATLDQRAGACRATLRRLGHSERSLASLAARVREQLVDQELPYRTLEAQLRSTGRHGVQMIRLAIKWLWEHGELVYLDLSPSLHHEQRAFALTSEAFPSLDLRADAVQEAADRLVAAHVRAFGPVSARDIAWWSGMGHGRVAAALQRQASDLVPVRIEGLDEDLVMHGADVQSALAGDEQSATRVVVLAYEDPSLKGYFSTRARYVAPKDYATLFNSIGEARASIMLDGRVVGVWSWDRRTAAVTSTLFATLNRRHLADVHERLIDMQGFLRDDLPSRGYAAAGACRLPACGSGHSSSTTAASSR